MENELSMVLNKEADYLYELAENEPIWLDRGYVLKLAKLIRRASVATIATKVSKGESHE